MKTIALSLTILLLGVGCETGTRYDKNDTKIDGKKELKKIDESILNLIEDRDKKSETQLTKKSYIEEGGKSVNHKYDPENPLNSDILEEDSSYIENNKKYTSKEESSFSNENITDGLNIKSIRVGYHDTYTRLVFDIYKDNKKATKVGKYNLEHNPETDMISVTLNGYSGFSAKIPNFSKKSIVEKIYRGEYIYDSEFNFSIKLRDSAKVKSYAYKNPARLIIDITPF